MKNQKMDGWLKEVIDFHKNMDYYGTKKVQRLIRGEQMENFKVGDKVKYTGCSIEQVRWGDNTNPEGILVEGDVYYLEKIEIHSWHTKFYLRGIKGKFNSVCFEKV